VWDPEGGHCSPSSAAAAPRRGSFSTPHTPQYPLNNPSYPLNNPLKTPSIPPHSPSIPLQYPLDTPPYRLNTPFIPHTPQYLTPPGPTVRSRGSACRCPVAATTAPPRRRRSTASTPKGLPDLLATDIGCQFAWHLVLVSTQLPFGHSCGGYVCALNPK